MKAPTKESKDGGREEKVAKENRKTIGGERNQLEEETERGDGKKKFVKNPSWIEGKKKEKLNKNIGETNKINRV